MEKGKVILDYAARPRFGGARKWVRRVMWIVLVMVLLVGMPLGWLRWGWYEEQGAIACINKNNGYVSTGMIWVPGISACLPEKLKWLQMRTYDVSLNPFKNNFDWSCLGKLHHLEKLTIYSKAMADEGLAHLQGLTGLRYLSLWNTRITDSGLVNLQRLTRLECLNLNSTNISDFGLKNIQGLTHLRFLSLGATQITDAGLANLKGMKNLYWLYLDNPQITDAGLVHLRDLTELRALSFFQAKITDNGIMQLRGLSKLQALNLADTQVTDKGYIELKKALPNCKITP